MKGQLLRDSVDILRKIRTEIQTTVEDSVIHDLDKVIHDLEDIQKRCPDSYNALEVLLLLGKAIEYLPQIADALKHLTHMLR